MTRKYDLDLLEKMQEKQETINVQGAKVLVKNIPDCDEKSAKWIHVFTRTRRFK